MEAAGNEVGAAISEAGVSIASSYEAAAGRIADLARSLSDQTGRDVMAPLKNIEDELKAMVETLSDGVRKMQGFAVAVGDGAKAGSEAANSFQDASQSLITAVTPVRSTVEQINETTRGLRTSVDRASEIVVRSSEAVAASAERTLVSASATISSEQEAIQGVIASIEHLVKQMQGQGDRIDDIDQKLGSAFELYATKTEASMQSIRTHVNEMSGQLNQALDSMRAIIDSAQEFKPQQRRTYS
jgi:methyl-accepting chemotaxis protein